MIHQRHLHRGLVVAAAGTALALAASGSALALGGSAAGTSSAASTASTTAPYTRAGATVAGAVRSAITTAAVAPTPTAAAASPSPTSTQATHATRRSTTAAAASSASARHARPAKAAAPAVTSPDPAPPQHVVRIGRYLDAPGSQSAIDRCNLVLWTHHPFWLAGHNWCGFQWMAFVATGTTVRVTSGPAAGTYVVTGHLRLGRQSGSLPRVDADLVLQTCVGSSTGLTLLHRA